VQLIKFSANKPTFRTVRFNETGISLVVGRKKSGEQSRRQDTYNGVGKSLLLYLVNFCLCSKPKEELKEKLPGWIFTLDFRIGENLHTISRSTDDQSKVTLDGTEVDLDKCRQWLERQCFAIAENIAYLTFRSLIGNFLRTGKAAYQSYERLNFSEKAYQKALRMAFLLGLDIDLTHKKFALKESLDHAVEMNNNFSKDPLVREYFLGEKDINIDLRELEDELAKLERAHKDFCVAENYRDVEKEANEIKRELQVLRNREYSADSAISHISESLDQKAEVDESQLLEVYERVRVALPEAIKASLREVAKFHRELVDARKKRLTEELRRFKKQRNEIEQQQKSLNADLNNKVKFLNAHGAFSEYVSLSEQLAAKKAEVDKLRHFQKMTKAYKDQARELKLKLKEEDVRAARYLEENESEIAKVTNLFRDFTKRIYPDKGSGLIISNNEGENQTRFDVEAKILDDASDGINEVKIFCFDLTVLLARRNHSVDFLFHDSRLFADIDPRQKSELFRIAGEYSKQRGIQYIATLNEDLMEAMREWLSPEEFEALIESNVVLELTDESAEAKLLGIEVDLDYE